MKPNKIFGTKDNADLVMLFLKTNFHKLPTSFIFPPPRKKNRHDISTNPYNCMNGAYIHIYIHNYHMQNFTGLQYHCSHETHKEFLEIVMKEIPTGSEVPHFNGT
jgi:hypothetical protein